VRASKCLRVIPIRIRVSRRRRGVQSKGNGVRAIDAIGRLEVEPQVKTPAAAFALVCPS
jgi:hypothetical protein